MGFIKCPECGSSLTQEMLDVNMCWECGKILDESLLDEDTLKTISQQTMENNPLDSPQFRAHKLTTGYNFEDKKILDYLGIVSGEVVLGTGFLSDFKASFSDAFGINSQAYTNKIKEAKQEAMCDMMRESISKGGNAIIGITYSYVSFSNNMIGISVNGTSVVLDK